MQALYPLEDSVSEETPSIVKSGPDYDEEPVIDIDLGFTSGDVRSFTVRPQRGDYFKNLGDVLDLNLHDEQGVESLAIYKTALAWLSVRHRVIRTRRPGPPKAPGSTTPPEQSSPEDQPDSSSS